MSMFTSRIGLGTVEIGIADYGVGSRGLPSEQEAIALLKTAVESGITYIDTARAYDVAEERIGKSGIGKIKHVVIGTKCAQFLEKGEDPRGAPLEDRIRADIEESLRALRAESLQLVQLHGGSREQIERGEIIEIMQELIDEGKVQYVGIATRGEEAALAAIQSGFFETIQAAYNILDQRIATQVLPAAQEDGIHIVNRSVLLKGALTPHYADLPDTLALLKENAAKAQHIAAELEMNLPSLALRFVLSHPTISVALIGTTKAERLKWAVDTANQEPLLQDTLEQLYKLAITDPNEVDPSKWPKEMQTI